MYIYIFIIIYRYIIYINDNIYIYINNSLLTGKVTKVTVSQRVETSPSIIVTSQFGYSANMERIAKAQTLNNPESHKQQQSQKTLELNPRHPIIVKLNELVLSKPNAQETKDLAIVIYDTGK